MTIRFIFCFAVGAMLFLHAPLPAFAQETPLVPPWGQDLLSESVGQTISSAEDRQVGTLPPGESPAPPPWSLRAEYLLWWTKSGRIPPLLTRGEATDERPGAFGQPFTKLLYGDDVDFKDRHGGQWAIAGPWTGSEDFSWAASYFLLGSRDTGVFRTSPGNPVLARPFFNVLTGEEDSSLITYPGVASGGIAIMSHSFLHGAEGQCCLNWWREEHCRVMLFLGLRYLGLYEDLSIDERSLLLANAPVLPGRTIHVNDRFNADNNFLGAQLGTRIDVDYHRWTLSVTPKIAVGATNEQTTIRGRTTIDTTPAVDVPAGLLALASNSGQFSRTEFGIVPEIAARLGLRVTERLTLYGGYSVLYWSRIARPGEQIDRNLNPNLIPTSGTFGGPAEPNRPAPLLRSSEFWAQGMMFGLEFRY